MPLICDQSNIGKTIGVVVNHADMLRVQQDIISAVGDDSVTPIRMPFALNCSGVNVRIVPALTRSLLGMRFDAVVKDDALEHDISHMQLVKS